MGPQRQDILEEEFIGVFRYVREIQPTAHPPKFDTDTLRRAIVSPDTSLGYY